MLKVELVNMSICLPTACILDITIFIVASKKIVL